VHVSALVRAWQMARTLFVPAGPSVLVEMVKPT
jgi:hypothetical protein